jgi:surface protein
MTDPGATSSETMAGEAKERTFSSSSKVIMYEALASLQRQRLEQTTKQAEKQAEDELCGCEPIHHEDWYNLPLDSGGVTNSPEGMVLSFVEDEVEQYDKPRRVSLIWTGILLTMIVAIPFAVVLGLLLSSKRTCSTEDLSTTDNHSPTLAPVRRPSSYYFPPTTTQEEEPSRAPMTEPTTACFAHHDELIQAVDDYLREGATSAAALRYGFPMTTWCVIDVTHFHYLFSAYRNPLGQNFTESLHGWNTSAATDMTRMFDGCTMFNGDVSPWDVSNVKNMNNMFRYASAFNGDLSAWKVGQVTTMRNMFREATSFAPPTLNQWDVSRVTDTSMQFAGASAFNADISEWDVRNVKVAWSMFRRAVSFNQSLQNWNFSSALTLDHFAADATAFSQNLCSWSVPTTASRVDMFSGTACPVTDNSTDTFCFDCSS